MSRPQVFATTTVLVVDDVERALAFDVKLGFEEPASFAGGAFGMANRNGFDVIDRGPRRRGAHRDHA